MPTPMNPSVDTDLRRVILDSTRHLLVRDGYQSVSMRKIARAIGYSATSIYLHFQNKDALIHALIEEGMDQLLEALKTVEATHPADPIACLQALCRAFVDFGLENPEYYEIMFMLHPERMERYPAEKYRRARRNLDVIAATLADGVAQGVMVVEDVRVAASSDDAEEGALGNISRGSSDLELVFDGGGNQTVGLRFTGVAIPPRGHDRRRLCSVPGG